jgi:hypothetical protein
VNSPRPPLSAQVIENKAEADREGGLPFEVERIEAKG